MAVPEDPTDDHALIEVLRQAQDLGFVGPGAIEAQVGHGNAFARAVAVGWAEAGGAGPHPDRVADLGSGGGLPALVLALLWSDAEVTLIEAGHRRAAFLNHAVNRLRIGGRVTVVEGRAELVGRDTRHRASYRAVTSRAFGPPAVTAECGAPLLGVGGVLVVSEPPAGPPRWPPHGLATLGMGPATVGRSEPRFAVVAQIQLCPERYPRRVGVPSKRPLF